jgi:hypothetical protein
VGATYSRSEVSVRQVNSRDQGLLGFPLSGRVAGSGASSRVVVRGMTRCCSRGAVQASQQRFGTGCALLALAFGTVASRVPRLSFHTRKVSACQRVVLPKLPATVAATRSVHVGRDLRSLRSSLRAYNRRALGSTRGRSALGFGTGRFRVLTLASARQLFAGAAVFLSALSGTAMASCIVELGRERSFLRLPREDYEQARSGAAVAYRRLPSPREVVVFVRVTPAVERTEPQKARSRRSPP